MMRDITLGQFYDTGSVIHRLDPRTKILCTILYIVAVFSADNVWGMLAVTAMLGLIIALSRVPFGFIVRGLRSILFILLFTAILNLFLQPGDVLVRFWIFTISWQGLQNALLIAARLILLILGSSMMTLTATPLQLSEGLERLMTPLKFIGLPVHDIAMMISIALRFIPVLLEETDRIMMAQKARGVDFEEGKLRERLQALVPIFVPLLLSLFRRADELALAMESRCYRGDEGRTRMNELRMEQGDWIALAVMLVFCVGVILTKLLPSLLTLITGALGIVLGGAA